MSTTSNYGEMVARIADELGGRTELSSPSPGLTFSPIQYAITDAITYWEHERFWFNELRTTGAFNTVTGREFYTSADWSQIPNLLEIDKLSLTVSTVNRYFMVPRTIQYMEDISINSNNTGLPIDYCYYNFQIRFYPIPDIAYPVNVLATQKFATLVLTSDLNPWTTDAEQLTRATAKWFLFRDTIQDPVGAQIQQARSMEALANLKAQTFGRIASRKVMPTYF